MKLFLSHTRNLFVCVVQPHLVHCEEPFSKFTKNSFLQFGHSKVRHRKNAMSLCLSINLLIEQYIKSDFNHHLRDLFYIERKLGSDLRPRQQKSCYSSHKLGHSRRPGQFLYHIHGLKFCLKQLFGHKCSQC